MIKMKTVLLLLIGLTVGSQSVIAGSLEEKLQARRDLMAVDAEFTCKSFVKKANKGDLVAVDAFVRAGISKNCVYTASSFTGKGVLAWRGAPWAGTALSAAVSGVDLDVVEYLIAKGFPWKVAQSDMTSLLDEPVNLSV